MRWHEPGRIDVRGGTWTSENEYALQPTARRYEQYEMSIAAKVLWCYCGVIVVFFFIMSRLTVGGWDHNTCC